MKDESINNYKLSCKCNLFDKGVINVAWRLFNRYSQACGSYQRDSWLQHRGFWRWLNIRNISSIYKNFFLLYMLLILQESAYLYQWFSKFSFPGASDRHAALYRTCKNFIFVPSEIWTIRVENVTSYYIGDPIGRLLIVREILRKTQNWENLSMKITKYYRYAQYKCNAVGHFGNHSSAL